MNEFSFLDDLRKLFEETSKEKLGVFDGDELSVDYSSDLGETLNKYASMLSQAVSMLESGGQDDVVAQSALMMIRTHAISLSSFFDAIADDAEILLKSGKWADMPGNV
jgi:hypothetical protein